MIETMVLLIFFAYLGWYYLLVYLEKRKSPPGPLPIPILGNLVQLALAGYPPSVALDNLAKKYGQVFQLRTGMKTMVVCTSMEAITKIYNSPETYGRDHSGSWHDRNFQKNLGIGIADGPHWEKTKQWTIRNLREFGFGKSSSMEVSIHDQLDILFEEIDKTRAENNDILKISGLFNLSVFKILWKMIVGHCTDEGLKIVSNLMLKSEEMMRKGTFGAGLITAFPFVRFIFPEATGHAAQMNFYKAAHIIARDLLSQSRKLVKQKRKDGLVDLKPENLVEAFVYKAEEEKGNPDTIFTDENFIVIFMDLFQAGSDTNSSFMEAFILFMILYPDVQSKIVDEIEQFGRKGEHFAFSDKEKMIYTQATFWEIHRHTNIAPHLVPRRVLQDFNYKQYLIKKDTILITNNQTAYFSGDTWDDPMAFRPERFIEKGRLSKSNLLVPFGVGGRLCPGDMLSQATGFLHMTSILKKYKLSNVPRQRLPSQTMHEGIASRPFPFEFVITDRN